MKRDLHADLRICEAATPGPWVQINGADVYTERGALNAKYVKADDNDGWHVAECGGVKPTSVGGEYMSLSVREQMANAKFIAEAREGWPYAIRRALEAEEKFDELRVEKARMQERIAELGAEIKRLKAQIEEMKDEIAAWKKIALGFDKFQEGEE